MKAEPSGKQLSSSAPTLADDFDFGGLTVGPSLRVSYVNVNVDKLPREHGAGIFDLSVKPE